MSHVTPPRPQQPKWLAWPAERLPSEPDTFKVTSGRTGSTIAVALRRDGTYSAFDAKCFHHGSELWTSGCGGGDIEDGVVTCPRHGRRIDTSTGFWIGDPDGPVVRHRVYATRARTDAEGRLVVEVRVDERDATIESDAYNSPRISACAARRRAACAAITPEKVNERRPRESDAAPPAGDDASRSVRRRLEYDDDDDNMQTD